MRNLFFLSFLFVLSCSEASLKKEPIKSELEALLSEEDFRTHRCLHSQKNKNSCLIGTPYESYTSRTPSSDDELILKNNWFFDSGENLDKFYKVSRGFLKAQTKLLSVGAGKLVNKKAIALEGSAFFGAGKGWMAEFAVHQNKIGFLCSPTYSLKTDIGIEAELAVARSLSCTDNENYAGQGVSFTASISGELIGLPVGLGAAYSLSINTAAFRRKFAEERRLGHLSWDSIKNELRFLNGPELKRSLSKSYRYALPLLNLVLRPLSLYQVSAPAFGNTQSLNVLVRDMIRHDRSAGLLFKIFYARQLKGTLQKHNLFNLNAYFALLDSSITGCDAIGGSASLGLSVSPVSFGVTYSHSALIAEVGVPELATFGVMTPMILLNPFLLPPVDLRNVVKVARSFVNVSNKIQRQCLK